MIDGIPIAVIALVHSTHTFLDSSSIIWGSGNSDFMSSLYHKALKRGEVVNPSNVGVPSHNGYLVYYEVYGGVDIFRHMLYSKF